MKRSAIDNNDYIKGSNNPFNVLAGIFASVGRTTVRTVKNLPARIRNGIKRRINEYKRRPPRKDINKVYVLVGYTTKQHIDERYNAEKMMIIIRRGLLLLIFVLLLFITINSILPYIKTDQYTQMFGISSVDEMTENDPFLGSDDETDITETTVSPEVVLPVIGPSESSSDTSN